MSTATLDELEVDQADSEAGMIHSAIIGILRSIGPIAKNQRNSSQQYNYRGIDQIYNAVHPHFSEQGVYSTSKILDAKHIEGKSDKGKPYIHSIMRMRFTFWAGDGSHVSTEVIGEGIDYGGDKASNKAMSTADKYAILQLLKIPTAMVDADSQSPGTDEQQTPPTPAAPRKSAMELLQEQAAAAEAAEAAAKTNGNGHTSGAPANPPVEGGQPATDAQVKRLAELTEILQCGEKINAALAKRKVGSARSLETSDIQSIIDKLEIEAVNKVKSEAAAESATAGDKPADEPRACGPATNDQITAIKKALNELSKFDNKAYDVLMGNDPSKPGLKQYLAQHGKSRLADLDATEAAQLYQSVRNRSLPTFIRESLENYKPKN